MAKLELVDEGHLLDEDLSEAGLAERVVLEVEAVEAVEGVLVGMHVQGVHVQLVPAPDGGAQVCCNPSDVGNIDDEDSASPCLSASNL